jgi:hypothetical protein
MRYTIYEDPFTHLFAFIALPRLFVEGDELPAPATDQWFGSPEEALTALPALLDLEDTGRDPSWENVALTDRHAAAWMQDVPKVH